MTAGFLRVVRIRAVRLTAVVFMPPVAAHLIVSAAVTTTQPVFTA
ncbi:hypothetical protein [Streptomyces sp. NPDC002588]